MIKTLTKERRLKKATAITRYTQIKTARVINSN